MITDESCVVAKLRFPMGGINGLDTVMRGLGRVYRDKNLVIITEGPLFEPGWLLIAHSDEPAGERS